MPKTTHSQSTSAQNVQKNISTPNESEPPVSITWLFFDPARTVTIPQVIDIPPSVFQKRSQECRSLFCRLLRHEFEQEIVFWKPKERLTIKAVQGEDWAGSIKNIYGSFTPIPILESFAEVLDRSDTAAVHLVVTIHDFYPPTAVQEHRKNRGAFGIIPEYQHYHDIVTNPRVSPSEGAKFSNYIQRYRLPGEAVHDGRYPQHSACVTLAPPIQIYHPIFGQFERYISDPALEPTNECLKLTLELMDRLSIVDEFTGDRKYSICETLTRILDVEDPNIDECLDGCYVMSVEGMSFPILVIELKREMGDDECDPSTQAGLSMRQSWLQDRMSGIRDKCCCPAFTIAGGGPWMAVLGSVLTDKYIVQRLTDLHWCALSSSLEDGRIYRLARLLNALRLCIGKLKDYYKTIATAEDLSLTPHDPHPRYYPYPNSFTDEKSNTIRFEYIKPLDEDQPTCVTFLARTSEKKFVVKFVSRYGVDAHRFLAAEGHAPKLLYYGPLPDTEPVPTKLRRPDLSLGPIQMVVMDYISSCKRIPFDAKQQLEAILEKLHGEGYVFGDFRPQNIMFDEERKAKLIDFDWAGRFDMSISDSSVPESLQEKIRANRDSEVNKSSHYAYYPLNISTGVSWTKGVEALGPIRPSHDWRMLETLELSSYPC